MIANFTRYHIGHVLDVLRTLPDGSVDLLLTSPPFLALRSYLPAGHPDKALEMGSEPTPGEFLDGLLDVVEEARRVLAPHGSIAIELGDTYAGSGGAGGDYGEGGLRDGQARFDGSASRAYGTGAAPRPARARGGTTETRKAAAEAPVSPMVLERLARTPEESRRGVDPKNRGNTSRGTPAGKPRSSRPKYALEREADEEAGIIPVRSHSRRERDGWPLNKSLCLVPELFRIALVYGFNPLTGRETPQWRARNVVRWVRPNPPVGSLADKFRPGTSDLVIACVGDKRYFDLDAVREPNHRVAERPRVTEKMKAPERGGDRETGDEMTQNPGGAPPLDWWAIPGKPYKGSHYATFPPELCRRPIEAMCPRRVCVTCGKPSERLAVTTNALGHAVQRAAHRQSPDGAGDGRLDVPSVSGTPTAERQTLGWSECGCGAGCRPTTWKVVVTEVEQGRHWGDKKWYDLDAWPDDTEPAQLRTKRKRKRVLDDVGEHDPRHDDHWRAGVVLDPFAGSGTTLAVASGRGRSSIGIDLDDRNLELARQRIGMFLEVVETPTAKEATA